MQAVNQNLIRCMRQCSERVEARRGILMLIRDPHSSGVGQIVIYIVNLVIFCLWSVDTESQTPSRFITLRVVSVATPK